MFKKFNFKLNQFKKWYKLNSIKKVISTSFTAIAAIGIICL